MTIPYNSTRYSNILSMEEEFNYSYDKQVFIHKIDQDIILSSKEFGYITDALYSCLYQLFPKLKNLIQYFKDIATLSNKLEISIS